MIPLSVPNLAGNEWKYIKDCLDTNWVSSVGSYVNKFEENIASYIGAKFGIACSNGTSALHISLLLSGVTSNSHVIIPNITFVATANAIKYLGADPILIDVDKETLQMDLQLLEDFLSTQTYLKENAYYVKKTNKKIAVIMPVHVFGNMCDMDLLLRLSKKYNITIVEDSTEALGSKFKKQSAGTFGLFGCFSFNGNKIITTGGGGMIVTNDKKLAQKAKHLTTQAKSSKEEYIHDEVGYNYRLVNILAALGVAQLEQLEGFIQRKKQIADTYKSQLHQIPELQFTTINKEVESNLWITTIHTNKKNELEKTLLANKVEARPLWMPMNQLKMFKKNIYWTKENNADYLYKKTLCLPSSTTLSDQDISFVCNIILETTKTPLEHSVN